MIAAFLLLSVVFSVLTADESRALRQKRAFGSGGLFGFGNNFAPAAQGDDAFLCRVCMVFGRLTKNYPDRMSKALDTVCTTMNLGLTCEGGAKAFMGAIRIGGERTACSLVKLCKGALEQGLTAAKSELTKLGTDPAGTIGGALKGTVGGMSGFAGGFGQKLSEGLAGALKTPFGMARSKRSPEMKLAEEEFHPVNFHIPVNPTEADAAERGSESLGGVVEGVRVHGPKN
ncbi:hypothetical protein Q1695_011435 [Nippostrongylus brasiliensis]|nr:hypothetical protein Q1695_011435 [Nippostrongylus brasiliensis]